MVGLIKNLMGKCHLKAFCTSAPPTFTNPLLFIAANRPYILKSSESVLEAKAMAVLSNETGFSGFMKYIFEKAKIENPAAIIPAAGGSLRHNLF
jgi:hypothetical protein